MFDENDVKAAKVFLSVFGLSVEEKINVSCSDKLKILNSESKEVGKLNYRNHVNHRQHEVYMSAVTEFGSMDAFYTTGDSNTLINYYISENEKLYSGVFIIDYYAHSKLNEACKCSSMLDYSINLKTIMSLRVQMKRGEIFNLQLWNNDEHEEIKLKPFYMYDDDITHYITKGYNEKDKGYPYKKSSLVRELKIIDKDELEALVRIDTYDKAIKIKDFFQDKLEDKKEALIQMCNLMKEIDPDMYERINYAKGLLTVGNISLLDNFINLCLKSYSDKEIQALLGIKRDSIKYENAVRQLKQYYPKIG